VLDKFLVGQTPIRQVVRQETELAGARAVALDGDPRVGLESGIDRRRSCSLCLPEQLHDASSSLAQSASRRRVLHFKGVSPKAQVHSLGVKLSGAMAYYVMVDLNEGPIIW
jgi:hypothetical protein